jgi:GTP cyclohydrolase II
MTDLVDLARREVVALAHPHVGEALVVTEVEVGLGAVVGHEHLAVLERRHRAGIDVDVRVELEIGDADAAGSEDCGEGGGGDALS